MKKETHIWYRGNIWEVEFVSDKYIKILTQYFFCFINPRYFNLKINNPKYAKVLWKP